MNTIYKDKHKKLNSKHHHHHHEPSNSYLYLAFKSQQGCLLSVDIKISGSYTHSFYSGENNTTDLPIENVNLPKKEKTLFRFKSNAKQLYEEIKNARFLTQHQKECDI